MMNYDNATLQILVSRRFPQHVDSEECMETRQELKSNRKVCSFRGNAMR